MVRVLGTTLAVLAGLGALIPLMVDSVIPPKPRTARDKAISKANGSCPSLWAMKPVAKLPQATISTFADLSPRLITVTHHRSIMGPYHRNSQPIIDLMKLFRGSPEQARAIIGQISRRLSDDLPDDEPGDGLHGRNAQGLLRRSWRRGRCPAGWSRSTSARIGRSRCGG